MKSTMNSYVMSTCSHIHRKISHALIIFFLSVAIIQPCMALEFDGKIFNDTVKIEGKELMLNGVGKRTIYFFDAYYAILYLDKTSSDYQNLIANSDSRLIELRLLREAGIESLEETMVKSLKKNLSKEKYSEIQVDINQYLTILRKIRSVKRGDILRIYYAEESTYIYLNGRIQGAPIRSKLLNEALLSIWLGTHPVDDQLKRQLLQNTAKT
jgi:Chalcone isomerase-like